MISFLNCSKTLVCNWWIENNWRIMVISFLSCSKTLVCNGWIENNWRIMVISRNSVKTEEHPSEIDPCGLF